MSRNTLSRNTLSRTARRLTVAAAAATTAVLLTAVPAAAHVEVTSDTAQALAQNVQLTFTAESESATAGITQLRVVLPKGIAPTDVVYGEGPKGWTFAPTSDGYAVKGPAVKVGGDAEHSVVVRQLPDAKELVFKTLQTYSDGKVDRWIELGESGGDGHGHGNEAPVLKLKAAAPGAQSEAPTPTAPETSAAPAASPTPTADEASPQAAATEKDDDGGLSAGAWTGIVAAILVAVAAVVFLVRRKGGAEQ
ncbi:DUF1775 domain-containing protein [Streptomyces sp. NPDC002328]|uniref:DUF1775 domain-containing protein n=1 Tax=Streptomyces sp. NPDC002328 TaxID=3364642 RepID=UPI0036B21893